MILDGSNARRFLGVLPKNPLVLGEFDNCCVC